MCLALRGGNGDPEGGREMEKVGEVGYLKELWFLFVCLSCRLTINRLFWVVVPKVAIIPLSFSVEFVKESEMVKESWVSGKMLLPLSKDDSPLTLLKEF